MKAYNLTGSQFYYYTSLVSRIFWFGSGVEASLAMPIAETSTRMSKWIPLPTHIHEKNQALIEWKGLTNKQFVGTGVISFHYGQQVVLNAQVQPVEVDPAKETIDKTDDQQNNLVGSRITQIKGSPLMMWLKNPVQGVILKVTIIDLKNRLIIENECVREPYKDLYYELAEGCDPEQLGISITAIIDNRSAPAPKKVKPSESGSKEESNSFDSATIASSIKWFNMLWAPFNTLLNFFRRFSFQRVNKLPI